MKIDIKLNINYGYRWYSSSGIYVKGYIFDSADKLYNNEKLIEYFQDVDSVEDFKIKLNRANGLFIVVIKKDDFLFMATDKTRTFPLFYYKNNNSIYISDDSFMLTDEKFIKIDKLSKEEFLSTGYVTGNDTLYKEVKQLQAGEYFVIKKDEIKTKFYHNYITTDATDKNHTQLSDDFLNILDRMIKRVIEFAGGKTVVLPLSGGYDSRLIASLLKKHNYTNVVCFTYGTQDSLEVKISKKVAENFGFKWVFVEYNEATIDSNYPNNVEFDNYCKFATNNVSIFHIQDYFAVKYLKQKQMIPDDSIFIPGHSGDFLGGSHLEKTKIANKNNIIDIILKKHYLLHPLIDQNKIKNKIKNQLFINISKDKVYSIDEDWNLKERQAKFIINAVRNYEYFGYQYLIPLWDSEMIDFFKLLPLKMKRKSYFYEKTIFEEIFKPMGVDYRKNVDKYSKARRIIKKLIPAKLISYLSDKKFKDENNFSLLHNPLQKDVKIQYFSVEINSLIARYIIEKYIKKEKDDGN